MRLRANWYAGCDGVEAISSRGEAGCDKKEEAAVAVKAELFAPTIVCASNGATHGIQSVHVPFKGRATLDVAMDGWIASERV